MENMENEILQQILSGIQELKQEQQGLSARIDKSEEARANFEQEIQGELKEVRNELNEVKDEVKEVKIQMKENTDFIKALVHASEFQKADHDRLNISLAKVEGDTKSIGQKVEDVSKDLQSVEKVTQVNSYDIAKLRGKCS